MTGQSLLDRMELLNAELQNQAGEADVTKSLLALNVAQDYFEALAAARGKILGSQTGTVLTVNQTETTAFPTGLLRVDRLHVLDSNSRPYRELTKVSRAGGHAAMWSWPMNLVSSTSPGQPYGYWTNGTSIYWNPLPDGAYTVRWYGFSAAADLTASGTFSYPDVVALPLAAFGCALTKGGLDDDMSAMSGIATSSFSSVLDLMANFQRDGATGFEYSEIHNT